MSRRRAPVTNPVTASPAPPPTPVAALILRIWWFLGGLGALVVIQLKIMSLPPGVTWLDGLWVVVAATMIWARYLDITRYQGTGADDAPATPADFRAYALKVAGGSVLAGFLAHGLSLL